MRRRYYLFVSLLGLGMALAAVVFQSAPGYMDADYYFAGGLRLAEGHGFSELILWNYLDDPLGLPHPSHAYWMPLASILAALGMKFFAQAGFSAARMGFLVLAAIVPAVTAATSFSITGRRDAAMLAGLLAVFSGFYLPYLPTTDSFGLYMILGALFLLLVGDKSRLPLSFDPKRRIVAFLLGLLAALMHLTRADGVLWLFVAICVVGLENSEADIRLTNLGRVLVGIVVCILGYVLFMGPWILRNLSAFGTLFSPGGSRTLWITGYDELYIYPASLLTPERWLNSGLGSILHARLWALGQNMQTALAVQGEIFLAPLVLIGLWRYRRGQQVRVGVFAWALTFLVMTIIFPFQGARGGFFHSGAALQPLFWAVAPVGLDVLVARVGRLRGWDVSQATRVFRMGSVALALLFTVIVATSRILGDQVASPVWNERHMHYVQLEGTLGELGASPGDVVLVNNAPGYFIASGRPAISIPYGDPNTMLAVARRYRVRYLLLEFNQLQGEDDLYTHPNEDRLGLRYLTTLGGTRVFEITGW